MKATDETPWWRFLKRRAERRAHNDRDFECRYWWGDRGGYDLNKEHCLVCGPNP